MSGGEGAPRRPTRLERAEERLAHWQGEAASVERDARFMPWIPKVGLPCAAAALYFGWPIAAVAGALVFLAWAMGEYMVRVRRAEFAHHVRDAQAELDRARAGA